MNPGPNPATRLLALPSPLLPQISRWGFAQMPVMLMLPEESLMMMTKKEYDWDDDDAEEEDDDDAQKRTLRRWRQRQKSWWFGFQVRTGDPCWPGDKMLCEGFASLCEMMPGCKMLCERIEFCNSAGRQGWSLLGSTLWRRSRWLPPDWVAGNEIKEKSQIKEKWNNAVQCSSKCWSGNEKKTCRNKYSKLCFAFKIFHWRLRCDE